MQSGVYRLNASDVQYFSPLQLPICMSIRCVNFWLNCATFFFFVFFFFFLFFVFGPRYPSLAQPSDLLWPLAQGLPDSNNQGLFPWGYIHGHTHSTRLLDVFVRGMCLNPSYPYYGFDCMQVMAVYIALTQRFPPHNVYFYGNSLDHKLNCSVC